MNRQQQEHPSSDAGYTLAELLVALAIVAMIGAFMSGGLRFGTRVWERSKFETQGLEDVIAVQDALRGILTQAYPAKARSVTKSEQVAFDGARDEIRFLSPLPSQLGGGGNVPTRLFVERGRTSSTLKVDWCLSAKGWVDVNRRDCATETLIEDVAHAEFVYADAQATQRLSVWRSQRELPNLIEIKLTFAEGDERLWPDFSVKPLIDRPASCRYDPVSKRCRRA